MPKLAIAENGQLFASKNYIRSTKHSFHILPIPKSSIPNLMTEHDFDLGIFTFDGFHIFMPLFWC